MNVLVTVLMVLLPGLLMAGTLYAGFRILWTLIEQLLEDRKKDWEEPEDEDDSDGGDIAAGDCGYNWLLFDVDTEAMIRRFEG